MLGVVVGQLRVLGQREVAVEVLGFHDGANLRPLVICRECVADVTKDLEHDPGPLLVVLLVLRADKANHVSILTIDRAVG